MKTTTHDVPAVRRRAGRPRSFDREAALDRAMRLFWQQGYETTSVADLTAALGISPPSLYAAFGDKKHLFLEAVERYLGAGAAPEPAIDAAPTARDAAWGLLEGAAVAFTGEATPPGCLVATAGITGSPGAADVREVLAEVRRRTQRALGVRIARAQRDGERLPDVDADTLAALIVATVQGMSTLARDGASRDLVLRVARAALAGWG